MKKLLITTTLLLLLSLKPLFAGVAKGIDVREVQTILASFCFNPGPVDGVWGKKTEKAAEEFFTKYFKIYGGYFGHVQLKMLQASNRAGVVGGKNIERCNTPVAENKNYSFEKIPGSKFHSPKGNTSSGTWWGHNQSKIIRFENTVFTYVVENQKGKISNLTLYKKNGSNQWQRGTSVPCTAPGNILIDSNGGLHLLVHQPENTQSSGSEGSLEYYYFENAGAGDISNFKKKTVIYRGNGKEKVNKRIGASISPQNEIVLAFGLGTSEYLYSKKADTNKWKKMRAGVNLGHNFYYPYPIVTPSGYSILAIQDDYVIHKGQAKNPYHIAIYFENMKGKWSHEYLLDNTKSQQAISKTKWRTINISDIYFDKNNNIHVIFKDHVKGKWLHYKKKLGETNWKKKAIKANAKINWVRIIELNGKIFYSLASWRQIFLMNSENSKTLELRASSLKIEGIYPYIASSKNGSSEKSQFLDMLILNGSSKSYPDAPNYYLKISKSWVLENLN